MRVSHIGDQGLKISALLLRGGDQNLLPTMNRSLSVPDSGSLWDIHTSASSQSGVWLASLVALSCPPCSFWASRCQGLLPSAPARGLSSCICLFLLQAVRPVFGTYQ